jgi:hypothetical protein
MKKNLILLIILILIGAYYFWDTGRIEKKEKAEEQAKKVFVHSNENIGQITIDKGTEIISAKKDGQNWLLTSPLQTAGDKTAWDSIARTLGDAKSLRTIKDVTASLTPYGLDQPALKVTIADVDGATPETIVFGKKTPTGSETYAMISGATNQVLTVYNYVQSAADKSLFDLRDKTIVAMDPNDVQRIDVQVGPTEYQLSRGTDPEWTLTAPFQARADKLKVDSAINKIRNGRVKKFIDENPTDLAQYGLVEPATRVVFWVGQPGTESQWSSKALLFGASAQTADQVYAKREGQNNVFAVESSILSDLPADPKVFRLNKITDVKSWDINHVAIAQAGATIFEASKEGMDWALIKPQEGKVDYSDISDVIRAITDLEVYDFVSGVTDETTLGLDQPELVFSLTTQDATEEIALSAPKPHDFVEVRYGVREKPREIYALLIDDASEAVQKALNVKPKQEEPTPSEKEEKSER